MSELRISGRNAPCRGCSDRHRACSDHCQKPEYMAYREELETIKRNRRKYICPVWKYGDRDSRWR